MLKRDWKITTAQPWGEIFCIGWESSRFNPFNTIVMVNLCLPLKWRIGHSLVTLFVFLAWNTNAQTTQRNGLAEEFSASTCLPCKYFNDEYHPACDSIGVNDTANHVNAISYQMDYPGFGDLSYNLHAQQRYNYYFILGLPHLKVNGKGIATNLMEPMLYTALDTSRSAPAKFKITGNYGINTQTQQLNITVNVKCLTTVSGKFRVHIATIERHYKNYADTDDVDMPDYYYVMRRMFPDGNGKAETSWTANVIKTYTYNVPYQINNPPSQGSFDFWNSPLSSDLIAFVQDSISKRILQSQLIKPALTVTTTPGPNGIHELSPIDGFTCYPNPAKDFVHVGLTLKRKEYLLVQVYNLEGNCIYSETHPQNIGHQRLDIPVEQFPKGLYCLRLQVGDNQVTQLISVSGH